MSEVTRLLEVAQASDSKAAALPLVYDESRTLAAARMAADALGLSRRTADRHWVFARVWLADALAGG